MRIARATPPAHFITKAREAWSRSVPARHLPSTTLTPSQAFKELVQLSDATPFFFPFCVNTTMCYPYSTGFDVRTALYRNTAIPDFPAILDGIYSGLNGSGLYFIGGPPGLADVLSMPLLCNDYSKLSSPSLSIIFVKLTPQYSFRENIWVLPEIITSGPRGKWST